jgi:hypothetical protein
MIIAVLKNVKRFLAWYWDSLLPQYPFYHWLLKKPLINSLYYFICMFLLTFFIALSIYFNKTIFIFSFIDYISFFFILPSILLIYTLVILFIISSISYLISTFFNKKITFINTLKLTFHSTTLPFLCLFMLTTFIKTGIPAPLFFSFLLFFSLCALYEAYGDHAASHTKALKNSRYHE